MKEKVHDYGAARALRSKHGKRQGSPGARCPDCGRHYRIGKEKHPKCSYCRMKDDPINYWAAKGTKPVPPPQVKLTQKGRDLADYLIRRAKGLAE